MSGFLLIAKKEFQDLLCNRLVVAILVLYFILVLVQISYYDFAFRNNMEIDSSVGGFLGSLLRLLTNYGSLVAVAIGFLSMSSERNGGALNTLVVKPLYRDNIINGKFLGALGFILCILCLVSLLYVSGLLILFGGLLGPVIDVVLIRVPVIIFLSLLFVSTFYAFSMFLTVLINDSLYPLFLSILIWILLLQLVPTISFAGNISLLFGGFNENQVNIENLIAGISPSAMVTRMRRCEDYLNIFSSNGFEVFKLALYSFIAVFMSYIAFLRRDIA